MPDLGLTFPFRLVDFHAAVSSEIAAVWLANAPIEVHTSSHDLYRRIPLNGSELRLQRDRGFDAVLHRAKHHWCSERRASRAEQFQRR